MGTKNKAQISAQELKARNEQKAKFEAYLKAQEKAQQEHEAFKEANKSTRSSGGSVVKLFNSVIRLIFLSGAEGITIERIMEQNPIGNKKENYSIHTINRDWNRNSVIQVAQEKLIEEGHMLAFEVDPTEPTSSKLKGKQNNRIKVAEGFEAEVRNYLLNETNITEAMLDPNYTEPTSEVEA